MREIHWYIPGVKKSAEDPQIGRYNAFWGTDVVRDICDSWWYDLECPTSFTVVIVYPPELLGSYEVEVEFTPDFLIEKTEDNKK